MKATVHQQHLAQALTPLSRVANSRTLPILTNVLLEADDNGLTLTATDLDVMLQYTAPATISEKGKTTLPAKFLLDLIKNMPSEDLELSEETDKMTIKSNSHKAILNGVDAENYPVIPKVENKLQIVMSSAALKPALERVLLCASQDQSRPILTAVYFKTFDKALYVVATDSYRLGEAKVCATDKEIEVMIPAASLMHLMAAMSKTPMDITLTLDDAQAMFEVGDMDIVIRLLDGKYPDYRKLINAGNRSAIVDQEQFETVVKVAGIFAKESADSIVMTLDEAKQEIEVHSVASQLGENTSRAEAKITQSGTIALNAKYLAQALAVMGKEDIKIEMGDKLAPMLFTIPTDDTYRHVIMPVKS